MLALTGVFPGVLEGVFRMLLGVGGLLDNIPNLFLGVCGLLAIKTRLLGVSVKLNCTLLLGVIVDRDVSNSVLFWLPCLGVPGTVPSTEKIFLLKGLSFTFFGVQNNGSSLPNSTRGLLLGDLGTKIVFVGVESERALFTALTGVLFKLFLDNESS